MDSSAIIEFNKAIKDYGNNKRIGPVNLIVKKGEIVGFLGPNGSGKTTCIRLILGLIRANLGSVKVNGYNPITHHVEALRKVAYSPELPNIQTFLTPRELLNLITHELDFSDNASRKSDINRVLELVGLHDYAEIKVGKLSKGMVQRLSVAQALVGSPQTLILDEPMIGLDPAGVAHFRDVFKEFASKQQGTVFMSSHIMSEVRSLCTSVAMIHHGKILFQGPEDEVVKKVLGYCLVELETSPLTSITVERLRKLEGVRQVDTTEKNGLTSTQIMVSSQEDDVRPIIANMVVASGAKLYTIKQADNMLERAYLEALNETRGDDKS